MHPKIREQVDRINFDIQAKDFRERVLTLAVECGAPVEIVVAALADVIGWKAARRDKEEGKHSLDAKLHAFCARVQETYHAEMKTPWLTPTH